MSEEQHMAMPRLYGSPAYSRPPRVVEAIVRPFDPDELPLEAERAGGDAGPAMELSGGTWMPHSTPPAKPRRARRSRATKDAAKLAANAAPMEAPVAVAAALPAASKPADKGRIRLEGRPFSLRGIGRIFGGDRK